MNTLLQVINFLKTKPKALTIFLCIIAAIVLLYLPSINPAPQTPGTPVVAPTLLSGAPVVTSTYPQNNEEGVPGGEIEVIIYFANPVSDRNLIMLEFSPPLPYYYRIENDFPSSMIRAKTYGGIAAKTTYNVRVKTSTGKELYRWSFTTSAHPPQSSSGLIRNEDEEFIKQYLPLAPYLPYSTDGFSVEYTNRLTLKITMKNQDRTRIEQEVAEWIKSKGVDPSTHTIDYVNN